MSTISIRGHEVAPGEKVEVGIPVGELADGTEIRMPLAIVNGAGEGPTVMAIGCAHGDEMVGTGAIRQVVDQLDPASMKGSFIGVLAANVMAFVLGERVDVHESPAGANDLKKLLRTAKPNGSITERLAALLRDDVAPHCDYYLDLHSSAKGSDNYPRAIVAGGYVDLADELRSKIDTLAEASNIQYILKAGGSNWEGMYFLPTHVLEEDQGKAGIVLETGHAPTLEGLDVLADSIGRILGRLGITETPSERTVPLTYLDRIVATRANKGGLWYPSVGLAARVAKGDLLGVIKGIDGVLKEEVHAPIGGVVIKVATTATLMTGVRTHVIGVPAGS